MRSNQFSKLEEFTSQEFEFAIGRNTYMAIVSYDIATSGENPSWDYPGDAESDIINIEIESVDIWNDDRDQWFGIDPCEEVQDQILAEIQNRHEL